MDFRNIYRENVFQGADGNVPQEAKKIVYFSVDKNGTKESLTPQEYVEQSQKRSDKKYFYIDDNNIEIELKPDEYFLPIVGNGAEGKPTITKKIRESIIHLFAKELYRMLSILPNLSVTDLSNEDFEKIYNNIIRSGTPKDLVHAFRDDKNALNIKEFLKDDMLNTIGSEFGKAGIPSFKYVDNFLKNLGIFIGTPNERLERNVIIDAYQKAYNSVKSNLDADKARAVSEAKEYYTKLRNEASEDPTKDLPDVKHINKLRELIADNDIQATLETSPEATIKSTICTGKDNLNWIAEGASHDNLKFISVREYIEAIISIETEIESNSNNKPITPDQVWSDVLKDYNSLLKRYEDFISNNKDIKSMVKDHKDAAACLKHAGNAISSVSFLIAGVTGALSLIPGGVQYASYISGLAKHGRRIGKLLTNAGSPLKVKGLKDDDDDEDSKEDTKLRKKTRKMFGIGDKDKQYVNKRKTLHDDEDKDGE